jgi:hypothetical protein
MDADHPTPGQSLRIEEALVPNAQGPQLPPGRGTVIRSRIQKWPEHFLDRFGDGGPH